jgi:formate hydrogenlyase subunit 6/NADH:ubiquinone oxidoreductase subunit I
VIDVALGVIPQLLKNLFSRPMTVPFPKRAIPIPEEYRGEHTYDIDVCTNCGLCSRIGPNRAIERVVASEARREGYPKTYPQIDLGKCCFCGLCQDICPAGALELTKGFFLSTNQRETVLRPPFGDGDPG